MKKCSTEDGQQLRQWRHSDCYSKSNLEEKKKGKKREVLVCYVKDSEEDVGKYYHVQVSQK